MSFGLHGSAWLNDAALFDGLALDIPLGWTCLLGVSGAGKSTILRLMAGLPVPAWFAGEIRKPPRVAYMAQDDLLQPRLSVLHNVLIAQHLRGAKPELARAQMLLDSVGLAAFAQRRPASLSGGQRQRVALCRALIEDAPLVLLDEPFAALDAGSRRKMQDLCRQHLTGRAVLLVTHDPVEALRLGDQVLLLADGGLRTVTLPNNPAPRAAASHGFAQAYDGLMAQLAAA